MNIDKLKKVIQEANLEIRSYWKRCMDCGYGFDYCKCKPKKTEWYRDREIRLADVLLAIDNDSKQIQVNNFGVISHKGKNRCRWILDDNNLNNQSDECKEFLIKLLVK